MDIATFRANFPEFADTTRYPDATVSFWASIGERLISTDRWGSMYPEAVQLFTAHNITLAYSNARYGAAGVPVQAHGQVSQKALGQASISYDTTSAIEVNAGHWNLTTYGRQYIRLARMFGAGAVQL